MSGEQEMNVIEAHLKFNKKLVILISGLAGTFKNKMAKDLANHFDVSCVSLRAFVKKDYDKISTLPNNYTFVDYDNVDAYDWAKLNAFVEGNKSSGIIVYGFAFPKDLIKFEPDFHLNIKISKHKYIEERHKFLQANSKANKKLAQLVKTKTEQLMINSFIYPQYLDYVQRSTINRFFNANEKSPEQIFDELFDHIITLIEKNLYRNKPQSQYQYQAQQQQAPPTNNYAKKKKDDDDSSPGMENDWDATEQPIGSTPDNETYIVATIPFMGR